MKKLFYISFFLIILLSISYTQTVYITKTGSKYHSEGCSYLKKSSYAISLKDAIDRGYTACSRCDPPSAIINYKNNNDIDKGVLKNKTKSNTDTTAIMKNVNKQIYYGRCQAITKKGTQCKRNAQPGSKYCWQHNK
jgi:hypothetical protein